MTQPYPFSAVVGQDQAKLAVILCAIDPGIGGALIFGPRGTGKSTILRGLAGLLPPIRQVEDCPLNSEDPGDCPDWTGICSHKIVLAPTPVVDLVPGESAEGLSGSVETSGPSSTGGMIFRPGQLARANRGYLNIDEANLIAGQVLERLLDVIRSGENRLDEEGHSIRHTSRFVPMGACDPADGPVEPDLLGLFGLTARSDTLRDIDGRVEVIRRRHAHSTETDRFLEDWAPQDARLAAEIAAAREALANITVSEMAIRNAAELVRWLELEGHDGETALIRAARALAAYEGASVVDASHLGRAAPLALRHRLKDYPLGRSGACAVEAAVEDLFGDFRTAAE
ncbi:MAG: ATP-binding protein [Rhodobacteraceae bacterium]|nr:ATP-binding protein [Paracoccaceae bacterium]